MTGPLAPWSRQLPAGAWLSWTVTVRTVGAIGASVTVDLGGHGSPRAGVFKSVTQALSRALSMYTR
jgi:hypothetical protein